MPARPRRRRHRHAGHTPAPGPQEALSGWPSGTAIREVFDVDAAVKQIVNSLTGDELLQVMSKMPTGQRDLVLRSIGLRGSQGSARVNKAMASQTLALLRRDSQPSQSALLRALTGTVMVIFDTRLDDPSQWPDLLAADTRNAAACLMEHRELTLSWALADVTYTDQVLRLGLLAAIGAEVPAAAGALAFLAVTNAHARDAHARLLADYPDMPPVADLDFSRCSPQARLRQHDYLTDDNPNGTTDDLLTMLANLVDFLDANHSDLSAPPLGVTPGKAMPQSETDGEPAAHPSHADSGEPDVLDANSGAPSQLTDEETKNVLSLAGDTIADWDDYTSLAHEIAATLASGHSPTRSQCEALTGYVEEVHDVAAALAVAIHAPVHPTRTGLTDATTQLWATEAARDLAWARQMSGLQGTDAVHDVVHKVRERAHALLDAAAAGQEPNDPGLRALHTLVQIAALRRAGERTSFAEATKAEQTARTQLPADLHEVILAASFGDLTLPPADPSPTSPQHGPQLAPGEDSDVSSCSGPEMTFPPLKDFTVTPAEDLPEDAGATGDGNEATEAEPAGADREQTSTATAEATDPETSVVVTDPDDRLDDHPGEVAPETASADAPDTDVDLSDLDDLLASGVASSLAALSTPAKTTTTKTTTSKTTSKTAATDQPDQAAGDDPNQRTDRQPQLETDETVEADMDDLDARLVTSRRYALAADLARISGRPAASIAARTLAAYGEALRQPTGAIASEFADHATDISRDGLSEDRTGQLLAWATAARVALVAPAAGAADILTELAPCLASYPALTAAGQALAEASHAGVVIVAETADAVADLADAEEHAKDLAQRAIDLIETAPRRSMKYAPANSVYQAWVAPGGRLRDLLDIVANNDPRDRTTAQDTVLELRPRGERTIDETFAAQRRRTQSGKIIAGARHQLLLRYNEVLDLASDWASAASTVATANTRLQADAWKSTPLARLRRQLDAVQDDCITELAALRDSEPAAAAGAAAAVSLLTDTFAISDGTRPAGPEPRPAYAAHHELLATTLALDPDTLDPTAGYDDPATAAAIMALASQPPADPADIYQSRAHLGDHEATQQLISGIRADDISLATALDRRRDRDVAAESASIDIDITELTTTLDSRRLTGAVNESTWSAAAATLTELADPARRDYARIRAGIADLRDILDTACQQLTDATLARIDELSTDNPNVAAHADTLREYAARAEIASAEEYLEQLAAGQQLPDPDHDPDHLQRFFPAVPDIATHHRDLLTQLRHALTADPDSPIPGSVTALTAAARTDLTGLGQARRDNANQALRAWAALTGNKRVDVASLLRAILTETGLEFGNVDVHPPIASAPGRQWLTLTGVRGVGKALTPALGSGMSPDSATLRVLLVRSAPSPATVIEWMSGERPDQTVLALWLPGALTSNERRAFTEAARGRPRPPVLLLDAAALAYLTIQPQPLRSTFAAIALPFTAVSPFKDTPGDAAPEMFYGRHAELDAILDLAGSSTISGGRQIGKSALLRAAQRRFEDGKNHRTVLTSLYTVGHDQPERLWAILWPHLADLGIVTDRPPTPDPSAPDLAALAHDAIIGWLAADPARQLLILLDEADAFLDADAAGNTFTHVDWCRRLMLDSRRRAKVVFAGLHRTARFESLPNQPLAHLGRPVSVGPLRPQHAYDLLTRPLGAVGFTFADQALPARVLALTNNMPALIQLFAATLIGQLTARPVPPDGPPIQITPADVDAVLADQQLMEDFRQKYVLTLNLDHRYRVIAYSVAQHAHEHGSGAAMTLSQLSTACRGAWPAGFATVYGDDFRSLVTECVDLGLLAVTDGAYRMRTPTVLRLLGTADEVLETLYWAQERLTVPSSTDADSYRHQLTGSSHRIPLTEAQLGQIMEPAGKVLVIPGSTALGVERVAAAIDQRCKAEAGRVDKLVRLNTLTPPGLTSAVGNMIGYHRMVLVEARTASTSIVEELLATAHALVAADPHPLSVIVIVTPDTAPAWAGTPAVPLRRFDQTGLRLWFDEESLPFRAADQIADVLERTGGWPNLLSKLVQKTHAATPTPGVTPALTAFDEHLASPAGTRELVESVGLSTGGDTSTVPTLLTDAFTSLVEVGGADGADRATLCALLELNTGLTERAAACHLHVADLVDLLEMSGCLYADSQTGALHPEPVLAAALARIEGPLS